MRRSSIVLTLLFLLGTSLPTAGADVRVGVGVHIGDDGVDSFHMALCNHYRVKRSTVVLVRQRNIPDDDLPVVFYLATHARVAPDAIVQLRLGGMSWIQISARYGLGADIFYVPVTRVPGPPYGNAWGHFKKRKRSEWGTIQLADAEVAHLVNVKFMSAHHGCSADKVISMRQKGDSFVKLNARVKHHKVQMKGKVQANSQKVQAGGVKVQANSQKVRAGGVKVQANSHKVQVKTPSVRATIGSKASGSRGGAPRGKKGGTGGKRK